jgi:hypothetical protein
LKTGDRKGRYRFTAEDEALIDRLVASGHPRTAGDNDPADPIEGRAPRLERKSWLFGLKRRNVISVRL